MRLGGKGGVGLVSMSLVRMRQHMHPGSRQAILGTQTLNTAEQVLRVGGDGEFVGRRDLIRGDTGLNGQS